MYGCLLLRKTNVAANFDSSEVLDLPNRSSWNLLCKYNFIVKNKKKRKNHAKINYLMANLKFYRDGFTYCFLFRILGLVFETRKNFYYNFNYFFCFLFLRVSRICKRNTIDRGRLSLPVQNVRSNYGNNSFFFFSIVR